MLAKANVNCLTRRIQLLHQIAQTCKGYVARKQGGLELQKDLHAAVAIFGDKAKAKKGYLLGLRALYAPGAKGRRLGSPEALRTFLENRRQADYSGNGEPPMLKLVPGVYLEKMDPGHRPFEMGANELSPIGRAGGTMGAAFHQWLQGHDDTPFFLWLENQPISTADDAVLAVPAELGGSEIVGDVREVAYANEQDLPETATLSIDPDRQQLVMHGADGFFAVDPTPFSTTGFEVASPGQPVGKGCAYVVDNGNLILVGRHVGEAFHHSSLRGGKKVKCAGILRAKDGKVTHVDNNSGHYQPSSHHLLWFVQLLQPVLAAKYTIGVADTGRRFISRKRKGQDFALFDSVQEFQAELMALNSGPRPKRGPRSI
ncbi:hypothetical protein AYO40_01790 [Planctomycetaceae bacterium SCGC AG-212-D15]|nr:hypothetical protein AYO40_01790 [Planctomycetaceae bacterium SCGC AG-212-D15]